MSTPTPNDPKKPTPPQTPQAAAGQKPAPQVPGAPKPATPGQPTAPKPSVPAPPANKTPAGGAPPAKPGTPPGAGAPKPAVPGQQRPAGVPSVSKPGAPVPPKPGQSPAPKPGVPAAGKPPAPKPKPKNSHVDSNTKQLGQKLVDLGVIDDDALQAAYDDMKTSESTLSDILKEKGQANDDQLLQANAELHGMKVMNLEDTKPTKEAVTKVPRIMAEQYKLVPISFEGDTLSVAMSDPNNLHAVDDVRNFLGIRTVNAILAPAAQIEALFDRAYNTAAAAAGGGEESIANIIAQLEADPDVGANAMRRETSIDLDGIEELANSAPVRKLINMVLLMAIRDHASDVHFEPFEDEYKMRYRCDGVLYEMVPPPRHLATAISSRIKVMSNLDIAERRLPQDGRIELNVGGNPVDMRVSILPTMFGESVVIRVLDRSNVGLSLERIGMAPDLLAKFREVIHKPNGIVFVTGPTGAGKTTTLYSALSELNDIETKIITTEDPVEYEIDGLIQCPINHDIDFTFASALRAILRQDPDTILVGEVRDLETAQIAIQASLTGHLVFSTLHTNDAPSSITRLRDMGVEPYMLTATVEAIQAQRLVRRVCPNCKTPYEPTREQLMEVNLKPEDLQGRKFYYGEGCDKCNNLGFKGRTGLYELLIMDDAIRDMVSRGASTDQVRAHCRKTGTHSLRDAGLASLYAGTSTLEEVVRETVSDDEAA